MQDSAQVLAYSHRIGCLTCVGHQAECPLTTSANRCGPALSIPDWVSLLYTRASVFWQDSRYIDSISRFLRTGSNLLVIAGAESMPWLIHLQRSGLQMCDRMAVITGWTQLSSKVCPLLKSIAKFSNTIYLNWRCNYVVLPAGTEILSADRWGKSSWNTTVRINTLDPDKCEKQFFLKILIDRRRFRQLSSIKWRD